LSAVDELALSGTSDIRPNRIVGLEVTEPIRVKIGPIADGGNRAFQIVVDRADLGALRQILGSTRVLE